MYYCSIFYGSIVCCMGPLLPSFSLLSAPLSPGKIAFVFPLLYLIARLPKETQVDIHRFSSWVFNDTSIVTVNGMPSPPLLLTSIAHSGLLRGTMKSIFSAVAGEGGVPI